MNATVLTYVTSFSPTPRFSELDRVRLRCAATTDENTFVPAGTLGTVVAVWAEGTAYEVEFSPPYTGLATMEVGSLETA